MDNATTVADSRRYALGVDRGGTNARVGLVRNDGQVLSLLTERTEPPGSRPWEVSDRALIGLLRRALDQPEVAAVPLDGIGLATNGLVGQDGMAVGMGGPCEAPWSETPVQTILQRGLGVALPVRAEIDAKAAAWGEYLFGAGRGHRHIVYLTIGTGIGGGLILDGRLYQGAGGAAALAGHISVDMYGHRAENGMVGIVEDYASGRGIAAAAQAALVRGRGGRLRELCMGNIGSISSEMVFQAARDGDPLATEVLQGATHALGIAICSLLHLFNPDVVILGGGVVQQGELFLGALRRTVEQNAIHYYRQTPILVSQLGNMAGVLGAAGLFWQ